MIKNFLRIFNFRVITGVQTCHLEMWYHGC